MLLFISCEGQPSKLKSNPEPVNCNRTVYGSPEYIKALPAYICIPDGFIIDDYVRFSDLDHDGQDDFIAIKYNKKEDDQIDGDTTYWRFYTRSKGDTTFLLKMTLANIVSPFINDISYEYQLAHPIASNLFDVYPRRLSHRHSFQVTQDTITLSYKFEDTYGKRFVFVYKQANWYLENVEYFIGELPMYWWKDGDFYYSLNDALKVIETRKPKQRVSIDIFDLGTAFKHRNIEWIHLSDWHIDRIDETKWSSIEKVEFAKCRGMDLPEEWIY